MAGNTSSKKELLKKVLWEMSTNSRVKKSDITNEEIFLFMKIKGLGLRWISVRVIRTNRKGLSKQFREK